MKDKYGRGIEIKDTCKYNLFVSFFRRVIKIITHKISKRISNKKGPYLSRIHVHGDKSNNILQNIK